MQSAAPVKRNKKSISPSLKPKPPVRPKAKRRQPNKKKPNQELVKSRGFDLRASAPLPIANGNIVSGQSSTISQSFRLDPEAIIQFAYGYVARLVEMGYGTPIDMEIQFSYPWYLVQEIVNQLILSASGQKLTVSTIPRGLLSVCHALYPKNLPWKTGVAGLSWSAETTNPVVVSWQFTGYPDLNFGVQSTPTSNSEGYPVLVAPQAYTASLGEAAWSLMVQFLTSYNITPMTNIVDSSTPTRYLNDTSAFAAVYPQIGTPGLTRGFTTQLFSMHKIQSPIFSVFSSYVNDYIVTSESRISGGGGRYLAGRLLSVRNEDILHNKVRPIFVPVDFDDLYDLLATIMGTGAEALSKQQVSVFTQPTLPLSGMKVALILRAAVAAMSNKLLGSDLSTEGFQPLQFPMACVNVSTVIRTLVLPFVVIENLRSLNLVATEPTSKRAGARNSSVFVYAPVWGTYRQNVRRDWDYTYNTDTPLYQPGGTGEINIVSLTNQIGETIAITGDDLANAVAIWNNWINQFSTVMMLANFSSTDNNPALYCALNQRGFSYNQQVVTNALPTKRESKSKPPVFRYSSALKVIKAVTPSSPDYACERYIASNYSMDTPVYELYANWILPRLPVYTVEDIDKNCGNTIMPYRVMTQGSNDNPQANIPWFPELSKKWAAVATMSVYGPTGKPAEAVQILWDATKKGEGGFLGSMLAEFAAGVVGIPALAHLGSLIPF